MKKSLFKAAAIAAFIVVVQACGLFAAGEAEFQRTTKDLLQLAANLIGAPVAIWGVIHWLAANMFTQKGSLSDGLIALLSGVGIVMAPSLVGLVMRTAGLLSFVR